MLPISQATLPFLRAQPTELHSAVAKQMLLSSTDVSQNVDLKTLTPREIGLVVHCIGRELKAGIGRAC